MGTSQGNGYGTQSIMYAPRGRGGGGVKHLMHFYCVLHSKRVEGV